ncbi:MAG: Pycsar system effector family protein [Ginsengibacter sp.]
MKEILSDVYQHCLEMQKLAERKNVGLIVFNVIVSLVAIKLLSEVNLNCYLHYYMLFVLICSLVSIFLSLSAIGAQLSRKEDGAHDHKNQNLLFFGTAAKYSPDEYLKQLQSEYSINEQPTKFQLDRARQIVVVSQIALRKFKLFNLAFKWTIAGITTPLSVIFYWLFFDNKS